MGRCVGHKETRSSDRIWSIRFLAGLVVLVLLGAGSQMAGTSAARAADGPSPTSRPDRVEVQASNRDHIRFSVDGLDVQWREVSLQDGAVTLFDPVLPGFVTVGDPARPRTPRAGGWLVVPPGTRPELVTVREDWQDAGGHPLLVQGVPVVVPGEEPGMGTTGEILVLPGQEIPADAVISPTVRRGLQAPRKSLLGGAVALGEPIWWRGHRIVSWTLIPVRHDAAGVARQTLSAGTWEVRFIPDSAAARAIPGGHDRKITNRGDDRFAGIFLNGPLLSDLPTEAAFRGRVPENTPGVNSRGGKSGTLLGDMEGRLAVTQTRLYRVTFSRLQQLGYIPDIPVAESEIRLYQRRYLDRLDDGSGQAPYVEIEVPIHMVGEGDDFDGDDYFLFYGQRLRDDVAFTADVGAGPEEIPGCGDNFEMSNEANIYWVAASRPDAGQAWARMETATLPAASGTPLAGYRRHEHHEEQLGFRELLPETTTDRVYYNGGRDTEVNVGLNPLWSPDPDGGDVEIRISIAGLNNSTRPLQFHLVNAAEHVTLLENYDMATMDEVIRTTTVPMAAFYGESAKIVMSPRETRVDRVFTFLDWVDVSYDALYRAVDGELGFHTGDQAGARPIEVTGFTSQDLGLVDVNDPRHPVWIQLDTGNILSDGDGWKLSIEPVNSSAAPHSYFVAQDMGDSGFPEFSYYRSSLADRHVNPTELAGPVPDLVVITHPEFRDALDRWIEHRVNRADGDLNVHVVLVQDLYDWYSGGLRDAWALKRFADHVVGVWGSWALTLVGDANENALELGVLSSARPWATDWVPTHFHVQDTGSYDPELMASDKWYATLQAGQDYPLEDFPDHTTSPWEMYVGRLPCNSVTELNTMIDKIMIVENVQPGQAWRRRGVFFADDAWSNGYGADAYTYFTYRSTEETFARSERDSLAPAWSGGSPVALDAVELYLADYLDPYWEGHGTENRPSSLFKDYAESDATPPLLAALSAGALVAHYQGHANPYVLASEYWIEDRLGFYRKDVASLTNASGPWFFMGMGCHISDWAQNPVYNEGYPREQSLGEKFLVRNGGGASATYGSSGYEYIDANARLGEYLFRRWLRHPPVDMTVGSGGGHRSRWMLGELIWSAEADILAILGSNSTYREMVAQYTLLGDPLMILDAGEPEVEATLMDGAGQPVSGEVDLVALDATNVRHLQIACRDEAGIDRIEITDDAGNDLTSQLSEEVLPDGALDHQQTRFDLTIPISPYDHRLTVRVFDTGGLLETDRHYELVLRMAQTGEFSVAGEVIDPESFVFPPGEPVAFQAAITGATWFTDTMTMALTSENLELTDISFDLDKNRELGLQFNAMAPVGSSGDRSVVLTIDGNGTTYMLQSAAGTVPLPEISRVLNYPNPMRDSTRFIFESNAGSGEGTIRLYSVAGRHVAAVPFRFSGGGNGIVVWDGRDSEGDRLGNGTYLYRIEMETPAGRVVSDMQRLVVMR